MEHFFSDMKLDARIDLSRFSVASLEAKVVCSANGTRRVETFMTVRNVSGGHLGRLCFVHQPPVIYSVSDFVLGGVVSALRHEVKECLYIDGERAFEPHPELQTPKAREASARMLYQQQYADLETE